MMLTLKDLKFLGPMAEWKFFVYNNDDLDDLLRLSHLFINSGRPVILPAYFLVMKYGDGYSRKLDMTAQKRIF